MVTLIGIVSWMGACGYAEYPDVYGRVAYNPILNWIEARTGNFEPLIR
jgi:secreted trypsin-like serine protease